ncbi:biotin-dependent carboxyltransferase family protein [Hyphomonas oceanitis]|uniref:Allophanate hydrolase subunit 2 n=1 Tax=Hyphomonas oceanitis SCH89 TaxID=1280953 RepID=A0A059G5D4_9PROT|nr:biotin-dependent carboxyltransferase family protein [Hyphomonas oceanitis]KDA02057.1 allophanate hydrolase subunit 2 [Hyphomonas oceanitis SCH89]
MSITILQSGVQMTLQGAPRIGTRHLGVPASGPADPLSMALANRLVGNASDATAFEITFGGAGLCFNTPVSFALTGAPASLTLNGEPIKSHVTYAAHEGDELQIAPATQGCRIYVAVAAVLEARRFLGATSTYIPAALGGHKGRALKANDQISMAFVRLVPTQTTPDDLQPVCSNSYTLRALEGPDFSLVSADVWDEIYTATQRASRMGVELTGTFPEVGPDANRPSSAIWPGALQLPPGGRGFLLLADAQTTGGYPHILQVARADLHLLGQMRPGDRVRFLRRTHEQASEALRAKQALLSTWLPDFAL